MHGTHASPVPLPLPCARVPTGLLAAVRPRVRTGDVLHTVGVRGSVAACHGPVDTSTTLRGAVGDIELVISLGARKEGIDAAGGAGGAAAAASLLRSTSLSIRSSVSFRRSGTMGGSGGGGGGGGELMRSPSLSLSLRSPSSLFGRSGSSRTSSKGSSRNMLGETSSEASVPPLRSVESGAELSAIDADAEAAAAAAPAPLPPPPTPPPVLDGIEEASITLKKLGGRLSDEELLANQIESPTKMRGSL